MGTVLLDEHVDTIQKTSSATDTVQFYAQMAVGRWQTVDLKVAAVLSDSAVLEKLGMTSMWRDLEWEGFDPCADEAQELFDLVLAAIVQTSWAGAYHSETLPDKFCGILLHDVVQHFAV